MKIDRFQADLIDGEYQFIKLPNHGSVGNGYSSNGYTYTPNRIPYHDTLFILYCNQELNEHEFKKLEEDWRSYCPN